MVLADWGVRAAARRWPAALREDLLRQWRAELAEIAGDPATPATIRWWRAVCFAASLAAAPAAEPTEAVDRIRRLTGAANLIGVTLLAGGLCTVAHALAVRPADRLPRAIVGDVVLLGLTLCVMALVGARSVPDAPTRIGIAGRVGPIAALLFGFLLAGNPVAVMPFMGVRDIAPAIVGWTLLSFATLGAVRWLRRAGWARIAAAVAVGGSLITLDIAAILGSVHAAQTLGIGETTAAAWFPLALLPGGAVEFGPAVDAATFGGQSLGGLGLPASALLLGNLSAMLGPMLLCSAYLVAAALREPMPHNGMPRPAARIASPWPRLAAVRLAVVAAAMPLTVLAIRDGMGRLASGSMSDAIARIATNSYAFGFGFATHPAGQIGLAVLVAITAAHRLRLTELTDR